MMAGDQDGSYLELSWEMLDIARKIVEKSPGNTANMVNILSVLAEVTIERGNIGFLGLHSVSTFTW
jgi:nuclear autoantigenic sperm protein